MRKRLYRSSTDRAICGVCGGIAEYFDIDSVIVRLLFVLFSLVGGAGVLFYIIAALVIPSQETVERQEYERARKTAGYEGASYVAPDGTVYRSSASGSGFETGGRRPVEASFTAREASEADGASSRPGTPADGVVFEDVTPEGAQEGASEGSAAAGNSAAGEAAGAASGPGAQSAGQPGASAPPQSEEKKKRRSGSPSRLLGWLCVLGGVLIVLQVFVPHIPSRLVHAVFIICVGLILLLRRE